MRKMGPLRYDHPLVEESKPCPACNKLLKEGDYVTIVSLGPGDDLEEQAKAKAGMAYTAVAVVVHWACSGGMEEE